MNFVKVIEKKRDGIALDTEEINFFAQCAARGSLPDEQLAALLMAIRINGMDARETADLTLAMAASGETADLSDIDGIKVDKHSTGGVGDAVTLVCLPVAAACGVKIAKMSGRSLGHTGGTLDKLWSIPGMRTDLSTVEMAKQVDKIGLALAGQTEGLAPADKKLYALRDITATVDSLPLIASSIISKKLAAGADAIVLDVKYGSGALLPNPDDAQALARAMADIGRHAGREIEAVVSDMSQPLGRSIGNALEVREAVEILRGERKGRLRDMGIILATHMLTLAKIATDLGEGEKLAQNAIDSGSALERMEMWIQAQGGDPRVTRDVSLLPRAAITREVCVKGRGGYVTGMRCDKLGLAAHALGAGRLRLNDKIDYSVGIVMNKRLGDPVDIGEALCVLHGNSIVALDEAEQTVLSSIIIGDEQVEVPALVRG